MTFPLTHLFSYSPRPPCYLSSTAIARLNAILFLEVVEVVFWLPGFSQWSRKQSHQLRVRMVRFGAPMGDLGHEIYLPYRIYFLPALFSACTCIYCLYGWISVFATYSQLLHSVSVSHPFYRRIWLLLSYIINFPFLLEIFFLISITSYCYFFYLNITFFILPP